MSLAESLSTVFGARLAPPSLGQMELIWELDELEDFEIDEARDWFHGNEWACFESKGNVIEVETALDGDSCSLSLRALQKERWIECAEIFSHGTPLTRAWAETPPVTGHQLFAVDSALRHLGAPYLRRTIRRISLRTSKNGDAPEARLVAEEFIEDLADGNRWIGGEHVRSLAHSSEEREWPTINDMDMRLLLVPRRAVPDPSFAEAFSLLSGDLVMVRPGSRFDSVFQGVRGEWIPLESRDASAAMLVVDAVGRISEAERRDLLAFVEDVERRFHVYEVRALAEVSASLLSEWFADTDKYL